MDQPDATNVYPPSYRHTLALECECAAKCPRLVRHFQELAVSGDRSDMTVSLHGRLYALHSNVLIQSSFFAALLSGEWASSLDGGVLPLDFTLPDEAEVTPSEPDDEYGPVDYVDGSSTFRGDEHSVEFTDPRCEADEVNTVDLHEDGVSDLTGFIGELTIIDDTGSDCNYDRSVHAWETVIVALYGGCAKLMTSRITPANFLDTVHAATYFGTFAPRVIHPRSKAYLVRLDRM
ncbi:hypothetical protein H9P43_006593 [Blastocladiella emersonii ATCC 22665]|nr:hypothetical protein H9P43_006593 [Blastocladiella emersonii ATCC 22665]